MWSEGGSRLGTNDRPAIVAQKALTHVLLCVCVCVCVSACNDCSYLAHMYMYTKLVTMYLHPTCTSHDHVSSSYMHIT